MADGRQNWKVKPDTALKNYWNRNEEFADLFNALLYNGKHVIKAEELREKDTGSSVMLNIGDDLLDIQSERDVFKVVMRGENAEYAASAL